MKKLNKRVSLILIFCFLIALIGCSDSTEKSSEGLSSEIEGSDVSAESEEISEESEDKSEESSSELSEESEEAEESTANVYNKTITDENVPTYFVDFTTEECAKDFYNVYGVEYSFPKEGYISFTALDNDPHLSIETPKVFSKSMRYVRIGYRANQDMYAELVVNRSDGIWMGLHGSVQPFEFKKQDDFGYIIIDADVICADNVYFTEFRIDPMVVQGLTIDIKYIAGFTTKEAAEKFDSEKYSALRINKDENATWKDPQYVEQETVPEDNYKGTLEIKDNKDGTTTISYDKDGEKVEYTVPTKENYLSGGFAATDDVKRTIPNSERVGIYGENGEHYVGIFYFLWMGEHGDSGVFDINKIIEKYGVKAKYLSCGAWGPEQAMHFWGEPLYGYYYSGDRWVMRKHMELLTNANIDFLYLDVTNGYIYLHNVLELMEVCHDLNEQGYDAPQIVFYTNTNSAETVKALYDNVYSKNIYPDTWFYVDGKPVIIAKEEANINGFFTIREPQWPDQEKNSKPSWPWMDFDWPQRVFQNADGVGEAISVSIAQHSGIVRFSAAALYGFKTERGRSTDGPSEAESKTKVTDESYKKGYNFQAQWDFVFKCIEKSKHNVALKVKYVLVTGWNEWVAQRQPSDGNHQIIFIDTASPEYSRDAEMTRGLYFDNYYMQLLQNVYKLKGAAPVIVQDSRKSINVTGDFDQWDSVLVEYTDPAGDCDDRNEIGFGRESYINQTGRNDIVSAKVTSDTKNLYFYVKTAENISYYNNDTSWMQLYLNTDGKGRNGWYGYDYIINASVIDDFTTTVSKNVESGKFNFESVGEASYRVKGNEMMIAVPLSLLGIEDYKDIHVEFKWADSAVKIENMEAFYELGDSAPLGRLNWIYRNK